MAIDNNIEKLRELKNLTQEFMAKEMGCSQKSYSNIKKSGNHIKAAKEETVAKILYLSINTTPQLSAEAILNNNNQSGRINKLNNEASYNYLDGKALELYEKLFKEKDERM